MALLSSASRPVSGKTTQEALDPLSSINAARPDAVLLAIHHRGLPLNFHLGDPEMERAEIDAALSHLAVIRAGIRGNAGAVCIVQTVPAPPETLFGSFDRLVPGTQRRIIERLNQAIADSIAGTDDLLLDAATLADTIGLSTWHSPALRNLAKLSSDVSCLPIYADHVARLIAVLRGSQPKVSDPGSRQHHSGRHCGRRWR